MHDAVPSAVEEYGALLASANYLNEIGVIQ